jgi:hypothetical protein
MVTTMPDGKQAPALSDDAKPELRKLRRIAKDYFVPPVIVPVALGLAALIFLLLRGPI